MKPRVGRIVFGAVVALALLLPAAAGAQTAIPGPCIDGDLPHGARSKICVPVAGWNGQLVVFAHGYVAVDQPNRLLPSRFRWREPSAPRPEPGLCLRHHHLSPERARNTRRGGRHSQPRRGVHHRAWRAAANLYHRRIRRRAGRRAPARAVSGVVLVRLRRVQSGGQLPWPGQLRRRLQGAVRLLLPGRHPGNGRRCPAGCDGELVRGVSSGGRSRRFRPTLPARSS